MLVLSSHISTCRDPERRRAKLNQGVRHKAGTFRILVRLPSCDVITLVAPKTTTDVSLFKVGRRLSDIQLDPYAGKCD